MRYVTEVTCPLKLSHGERERFARLRVLSRNVCLMKNRIAEHRPRKPRVDGPYS